jgi:hypothetical protein
VLAVVWTPQVEPTVGSLVCVQLNGIGYGSGTVVAAWFVWPASVVLLRSVT